MNLFFRFLWFVFRLRFVETKGFDALSSLSFRVLPTDSDYFQHHLTNSRFPSFMDLGRLHWLTQSGLRKEAKRRKLHVVVSASQIMYLGLIRWGRRFDVETRVVYWDDKYFYLEYRFISAGKLCAVGLSKLVFMGAKGTVPLSHLLNSAAIDAPVLEECPDNIRDFIQSLSHRY
ncbi:thioesterase family protein [gamma proteobacterium HTCC5015]|nr:thioesterase family protein [gamma proteobacterium HTCC5015]